MFVVLFEGEVAGSGEFDVTVVFEWGEVSSSGGMCLPQELIARI